MRVVIAPLGLLNRKGFTKKVKEIGGRKPPIISAETPIRLPATFAACPLSLFGEGDQPLRRRSRCRWLAKLPC